MNEVKRSDVSALIAAYNAIRLSVTFVHGMAGGAGTNSVSVTNLSHTIPEKGTLQSLRNGIDDLFGKFSGNCNCLTIVDCNQTCQTTTCQSDCTVSGNQAQCGADTNQGCQSITCQSECTVTNQMQCGLGCQSAAPMADQGCEANCTNQSCQGCQTMSPWFPAPAWTWGNQINTIVVINLPLMEGVTRFEMQYGFDSSHMTTVYISYPSYNWTYPHVEGTCMVRIRACDALHTGAWTQKNAIIVFE